MSEAGQVQAAKRSAAAGLLLPQVPLTVQESRWRLGEIRFVAVTAPKQMERRRLLRLSACLGRNSISLELKWD